MGRRQGTHQHEHLLFAEEALPYAANRRREAVGLPAEKNRLGEVGEGTHSSDEGSGPVFWGVRVSPLSLCSIRPN